MTSLFATIHELIDVDVDWPDQIVSSQVGKSYVEQVCKWTEEGSFRRPHPFTLR